MSNNQADYSEASIVYKQLSNPDRNYCKIICNDLLSCQMCKEHSCVLLTSRLDNDFDHPHRFLQDFHTFLCICSRLEARLDNLI